MSCSSIDFATLVYKGEREYCNNKFLKWLRMVKVRIFSRAVHPLLLKFQFIKVYKNIGIKNSSNMLKCLRMVKVRHFCNADYFFKIYLKGEGNCALLFPNFVPLIYVNSYLLLFTSSASCMEIFVTKEFHCFQNSWRFVHLECILYVR